MKSYYLIIKYGLVALLSSLLTIFLAFGLLLYISYSNVSHSANIINLDLFMMFAREYYLITQLEDIKLYEEETVIINKLGKPEYSITKSPIISDKDQLGYPRVILNDNHALWYEIGDKYWALFVFDKNNKVKYIEFGADSCVIKDDKGVRTCFDIIPTQSYSDLDKDLRFYDNYFKGSGGRGVRP